MPEQERKPQGKGPEKPPQISPLFMVFWLAVTVLLLWNLWSTWNRTNPTADIPYSNFLGQVRANNVAKVDITGDGITGDFAQAILWPPPEAVAAATAKAQPAPASVKKPGALAPEKKTPEHPMVAAEPPSKYTAFRTTFPQAIGDPTLMPLLESHKVEVNVTSPSSGWLSDFLLGWLPLLLLFGVFWWLSGGMSRRSSGMFGFGRTKARIYSASQPKVNFSDVAGADEAKAELQEEVDFLKHPKKYHDLGARIPRGILLVGPPGTGKTLLARAVAGEAEVPFFSINASEFVEMFVGVGASRVRDLFRQAKEAAPAIVFIDELDAVGRRRGAGVGTVNDEREQTLNQLLGALDGFDPRTEVIILAATNRPDVLDPALLRPGRFDRQVVIGLPDRTGREGILKIHTRKLRLDPGVNLGVLARGAIGMNGADLANLCNEAALTAARHNHAAVTMADFEEAQDQVRLGAAQPQLIDPSERRVIACHESGHAVVAWLTPEADPVHKVTIVPHGQALGLTQQLPGQERHNLSLSYLEARLAVLLGGRTAEEIVFGEITTGAENDLLEATRLARRMVTRWGMGKLGVVAFKTDEQQPFLGYEISQGRDYSEATAARIDAEVQHLLEAAHGQARHCLTGARGRLDRLVEALLREETIGEDELARILGPRPAEAAVGDGANPERQPGGGEIVPAGREDAREDATDKN
ncbi:MAG: ATP-dependent zinc metalloprotease FtsH [Candidatus Binataceae bacterium]